MIGNFVLCFRSLAAALFLRLRIAAAPPRPSPSYCGRAAPLPLAQRRMGAMPRGAPYSAATSDHLGPGLWPSVPPPVPASLKLRALAATAAVILLPAATRNRPAGPAMQSRARLVSRHMSRSFLPSPSGVGDDASTAQADSSMGQASSNTSSDGPRPAAAANRGSTRMRRTRARYSSPPLSHRYCIGRPPARTTSGVSNHSMRAKWPPEPPPSWIGDE